MGYKHCAQKYPKIDPIGHSPSYIWNIATHAYNLTTSHRNTGWIIGNSGRAITQTQRYKMRKFDPWPVFFKREFNRNWPFLVGFAITGSIITKLSLGLTEEDRKKSVFAQRHKS
ncbi:hypothetical protein L1887_45891 [Cichorium endivia]|nr:hypothetical protein L1887_45891 [Cichorium endivia]